MRDTLLDIYLNVKEEDLEELDDQLKVALRNTNALKKMYCKVSKIFHYPIVIHLTNDCVCIERIEITY